MIEQCWSPGTTTRTVVSLTADTDVYFPADLPARVGVRAWSAHLSMAADLAGDTLLVATTDASNSADIAGTYSGGGGAITTISGRDYWEVPDFGTWVTDYLTFTNGASTDNAAANSVGYQTPTAFDIQARCRTADWDSCDTEGNHIIANGAFGCFNVARTTSGLWVYARYNKSGGGQAVTQDTCPWASLGLTDATFEWVRVTADITNGFRFWTGGPGSWSVVRTTALPGDVDTFNGDSPLYAGTGLLASSVLGRGFNGDISDLTVALSVGGTPWVDLNLAAMTNSADTAWASGGSEPDWTLTVASVVDAIGSIVGSVDIDFTLDTRARADDLRVEFTTPIGGQVQLDQWCASLESGWFSDRLAHGIAPGWI